MRKTNKYTIAKCSVEKTCPKCNNNANAIAVNRGTHTTLYCNQCGAYIKHASEADKRYLFTSVVSVKDETPVKVCMLYIESERTMLR